MPEITASRYLVQAGWDDVPHLSERAKEEILRSTMPTLRDARTKGIPALGSGAIYPIPESDIVVDPFEVPDFWPRIAGMDVGWKNTAVVWLAHDRENDIVYVTTEYKAGRMEPMVHAHAILLRGSWIPILVDPASRGRSQADGVALFDQYLKYGLRLILADNRLEAGIHCVYERMLCGRLKVFSTCRNWLSEYRLYRRDAQGRVVKEYDHLMDATRYAIFSGLQHARLRPVQKERFRPAQGRAADMVAGY